MQKIYCSFFIFCFFFISITNAQILFTESFSVILDSTKTIKGAIVPDFKWQTQKKNLIEFDNLADISIRLKDNVLTLANKIEFSKFGDETLLSGGYLYAEFRKVFDKKITLETFGQIHWAEARGMERKYAGGVNARWRIYMDQNTGFFVGVGPFYEYERWNYRGVGDTSLIPSNPVPIANHNVKLGAYVSLKHNPVERIILDFSIYFQSRFDKIFTGPRLASSSKITYKFTEHLGLTFAYQNIFDPQPVVPVKKLFNRTIFTVSVSF